MATCPDCGATVNVVSTDEGLVALDQQMDPAGEDRWQITDYTAQPHAKAQRVVENYSRESYVAHRRLCPFT